MPHDAQPPSAEAADLDAYLPAICAGDPVAFGRWVARAEPALRLALRPFAAAVDAEAVVQEALLRVWQVAPRFVADGRPNGLLRLGHRIARNLAISELRRLRPGDDPTVLELGGAAGGEPGPAPPDPLLRRAILECEQALPGQPARALAARIGNAGAEPDQVLAERLGMRLNTFLQNFTRARKLLAECLRGRGIELEPVSERGSRSHAP